MVGVKTQLRRIEPSDDEAMARVIRAALIEFGANRAGFAWQDPELDALSAAYGPDASGSSYWVAVAGDSLLGGVGIAPFPCAEPNTCELQKMYLTPEARGRGLGSRLLQQAIADATQFGYRYCYLETLTGMDRAERLYVEAGFQPLPAPWGNSGHCGCDRWYALSLLGRE